MTKPAVVEGLVFAVNFEGGGIGLGVVARKKRSILLCYFFGPKYTSIPGINQLSELTPKSACFVARVGSLGLTSGEWIAIGGMPKWDPALWPLPEFFEYSELTDSLKRVVYPENGIAGDPDKFPVDSSQGMVESSLFGYSIAASQFEKALRADSAGSIKPTRNNGSASNHAVPVSMSEEDDEHVEQAVIIALQRATESALIELEDQFEQLIPAGVGVFDGHEMNPSDGSAVLYLYGGSADALWSCVQDALTRSKLGAGAVVRLRFGPPGETTPTRELMVP